MFSEVSVNTFPWEQTHGTQWNVLLSKHAAGLGCKNDLYFSQFWGIFEQPHTGTSEANFTLDGGHSRKAASQAHVAAEVLAWITLNVPVRTPEVPPLPLKTAACRKCFVITVCSIEL